MSGRKGSSFFIRRLDPTISISFAIFCLSLLALSWLRTHQNADSFLAPTKQKRIGWVKGSGSEVKAKAHLSSQFQNLPSKKNFELFAKDTLFVGEGSRATVVLDNVGTLELEPNAIVMVVFDQERASSSGRQAAPQMKIKLKQGKLSFKKDPVALRQPAMQTEPQPQIIVESETQSWNLSEHSEIVLEKLSTVAEVQVVETLPEVEAVEEKVAEPEPELKPDPELLRPKLEKVKVAPQVLVEASQPAPATRSPEEKLFHIGLESGHGWLGVKDTQNNSKAKIFSKGILGLRLAYTPKLSEKLRGHSEIALRNYRMDQPNRVATLSSSSQSTSKISLGLTKNFTDKLSLRAVVGLDQKLSLSQLSSAALSLDLVRVPFLASRLQYSLGSWGPVNFDFLPTLSLLGPGKAKTYTSKMGHEIDLSIKAAQLLDETTLFSTLKISRSSFSTSFSRVQEYGIHLELGIGFGKSRRRDEGER